MQHILQNPANLKVYLYFSQTSTTGAPHFDPWEDPHIPHIYSFSQQLFTNKCCVSNFYSLLPTPSKKTEAKNITEMGAMVIVYPVFCVQGFSYPLALGEGNKNKLNN